MLGLLFLTIVAGFPQDRDAPIVLKSTEHRYIEYQQTILLTCSTLVEDALSGAGLSAISRKVMVECVYGLRQGKGEGEEMLGDIKMKSLHAEWGDVSSLKSAGLNWPKGKEWNAAFKIKRTGEVFGVDTQGLFNELLSKTVNKRFARVAIDFVFQDRHLWEFSAPKDNKWNRPWRIEISVPLSHVFDLDATLTRTIETSVGSDLRGRLVGIDKDLSIRCKAARPAEKYPGNWILYLDKKLNRCNGHSKIAFDDASGIVTDVESECSVIYTDGGFKFRDRDTRVQGALKLEVKIRKLP